MLVTKAAKRYATALFDIAQEREEVEPVLEDIKLIYNTLEGSKELIVFLRSPVVTQDDQQAVLQELFGERVERPTRLFLQLLVKKRRINLLFQIAKAFINRYNKFAGIMEVSILAARPLSEEQKDQLHQALEEKTGQKVIMDINYDASLKGGLYICIDDTVIDGTVKHKLQELKDEFFAHSY